MEQLLTIYKEKMTRITAPVEVNNLSSSLPYLLVFE